MNSIQNKKIIFRHLGLVPYQEAWDFQTNVFNTIVAQKIKNRDLPSEEQIPTDNYLFVCEHPHVYTLGKSGKKEHLLLDEEKLQDEHVDYFHINRGGDITYHGPGQLVAYPVMDLDNFFTDIHKYLRLLEEAVIRTLKTYGLDAGRIEGLTGVWLDYETQLNPRKICAFGVKMSRWVTMHGLALNINTDLGYFNHIVPCGIADKAVTSLSKELGKPVDMEEVIEKLLRELEQLFEAEIVLE